MAARVLRVDISRLHGPERAALTTEIDAACRDIGCLLVIGHGVPGDLIRRMHAVSTAFFRLPEVEKRSLQVLPGRVHGWTGTRQASPAATPTPPGQPAPDRQEGFSIGPVDTPPDLTPKEAPYFGRNLWPKRPPGFVEAWEDYSREMEQLAGTLMQAFALALGLPQDYFADRIDRHISALSAHVDPPQRAAPGQGPLRAGPHTDFGTLTILSTGEDAGGLEVCDRDGRWSPVTSAPDAFVVCIGDLMAQWTNGLWVSTPQRVVDAPRERAQMLRPSIAFLHQPNWHTVVECLPGCDGGKPPRYAPVTSGEHFERSLALRRGQATAG